MITVFAMMAVLWGTGAAMGTPKSARWTMIAVLMAGVICLQLVLPTGHPLREATGGDVRLWGLILGFGGLAWAYRYLLRGLRRRATKDAPPPPSGDYSGSEIERYARHIVMRDIGGPGQRKLSQARVLVVGAGGLGSPALQYLAAAGVGTIGVIDDDVVEAANLQRQVIHTDDQIGAPKVQSAIDAMVAQNPYVTVRPYHRRLTAEVAEALFSDYDLILDGTDNFDTRYLVNATAAALEKPLISAALTQWEGQISLYDPANGTPCYACVFPKAPDAALVPSCAQAGVLGPLPGVVGSMMAVEAIKHLTGAGRTLAGRLMIYDAQFADTRTIKIKQRADCAICHPKGAIT